MPARGKDAFNWKHLPDKKLYTDNAYARQVLANGFELNKAEGTGTRQPGEKTAFHSYWYGKVGRKQAFSIKSFLVTQNLERCEVILWLDISNGFDGYGRNPYLMPLLPFITVKAFDPKPEIKGTPWENSINLIDHKKEGADGRMEDGVDLAKRADAFRFIVLYNYGGVYFDLDVLFLRDFTDLLVSEFCYAWEDQPFANSALLYLKRKSAIATYILQKSIRKRTVLPWVIFYYSDNKLKDLLVYPCAFFDPLWQGGDKLEKVPFKNLEAFFEPFGDKFTNQYAIKSHKDFFAGCYAYHWHNQWKKPEPENSFFGLLEAEFNKALKIRQENGIPGHL